MAKKVLNSVSFFSVALLFTALMSCNKKDRLSTSTAQFSISPPAATLLKSETLTLSAQLSLPNGGTLAQVADWSISGTCVDVNNLNTTLGEAVIFSAPSAANELCDATITATAGGMSSNAQIAIVSYRPQTASNIYNVYSDALGIPANTVGLVFGQEGSTIAGSTVGYAPEGIEYLHLVALVNGGQVFITLSSAENLSAFNAGSLKFSIRFETAEGSFFVRVTDTSDRSVTLGPSHGFSNSSLFNGVWQEVSINISEFIGAGLNTSAVNKPFLIRKSDAGAYDIDAIRWERP